MTEAHGGSRAPTAALYEAPIIAVEADSPAYEAGFEPGCCLLSVDGHPLRDMIDWMWLSSDNEIEVVYRDLDGECGSLTLERGDDEDWGFSFEGAIFDEVRTCRNACTFCFMQQLPPEMRSSLSLRDDDFRLSFLTGTFVTLTNLTDEDAERIREQHISPLRVSLHAVDPHVRRELIGSHAEEGLRRLEELLASGIEFDVQIVLVPGVNDDERLDETLEWAYGHPGIRTVGIVPLGFTKHQSRFDGSYDESEAARSVIERIEPFQVRALEERGVPWVYAADEFYRNAYGAAVLEALPGASFYGDFDLYEDGVGILRSSIDGFREAMEGDAPRQLADLLANVGARIRYICGEAMEPYFGILLEESPLAGLVEPLIVPNAFFGGNVNVTGLLCGEDIVAAIRAAEAATGEPGCRMVYAIPSIIFNVEGLTLDDLSLGDIRDASGAHVYAVASNPLDYTEQLIRIVKEM